MRKIYAGTELENIPVRACLKMASGIDFDEEKDMSGFSVRTLLGIPGMDKGQSGYERRVCETGIKPRRVQCHRLRIPVVDAGRGRGRVHGNRRLWTVDLRASEEAGDYRKDERRSQFHVQRV